jgi:1-acyl-sn-glycerol-3-phosphate acyltransferase
MFRLILIALILFVYFLFGFFVMAVIGIAKLFKAQNAADRIAHAYVRSACKIAWFAGGLTVDSRGVENIPQDRACLFVVNHRSAMFDPVTIYPFLKNPAGFIAKKELEKIPLFSWWLKLANSLFIDRDNIREGYKTIVQAIEKLQRGVSILIFPEGTRNKDRESKTSMLPFHDASFKPAVKANVPIVPIALYNTEESFENHKPKIYANKVKITFGEPIYLNKLSPENARHPAPYVRKIMEEMLAVYEEEARKEEARN